jgi:HTH-type transcriptional regulator/antitoxin HigA
MNVRPIHNEDDYRAALKNVSALFNNEPVPGTPEGEYFDTMISLIETYEAKQLSHPRSMAQRFASRCVPNSK